MQRIDQIKYHMDMKNTMCYAYQQMMVGGVACVHKESRCRYEENAREECSPIHVSMSIHIDVKHGVRNVR